MPDPGAISYEKYLNGDNEGMAELIVRYRDGLILYLFTLTGNIQDAEELAVDTFVKLGVRRPVNKCKASFKTWLYTIGRNLAIDHLRKASKKREVSLENALHIQDDTALLESLYIKEEQSIAIHHAMSQLTSNYRQILWLIYFEGFTVKQAAFVLHKKMHNIEMLLLRAKKALRKQLEDEGFCYENL